MSRNGHQDDNDDDDYSIPHFNDSDDDVIPVFMDGSDNIIDMEQFIGGQHEPPHEDYLNNLVEDSENEDEDEDYVVENDEETGENSDSEDDVVVVGSSRVSGNNASASTVPENNADSDEDVVFVDSSRVSENGASTSSAVQEIVPVADDDGGGEQRGEKRRRISQDGVVSVSGDGEKDVREGEWNRSEIDGLFCSICMEAWTGDGDHQVCCLPCGHVYGMSCIKKWIQQSRNSGKCPQCNMKCKPKDVRKIYASRIVVVDEESQKRIRYLEGKCDSLEKKGAYFFKEEAEWLSKEAGLQLQVHKLTERTKRLEQQLKDSQSRSFGVASLADISQGKGAKSNRCKQKSSCFVLQKELPMEDARLFDVDTSNHILLIARRLPSPGTMHVLTKMSLMSPLECENISLPSSTKVVKDLQISSSNSRLALIASLGKTLSVLSTESNNIVLSYELPVPAWSCSWDRNNSHYIYAGLQNGMLLVFDMRQTSTPVQSMSGLTTNPVHSLNSLSHNPTDPSGIRNILTASSAGLSHWTFGGADERQFLIPETENQGVCISLAYCSRSDNIVASFRPKVRSFVDSDLSQPLLSPSVPGQGMHGSHVHYSRVGSKCYQRLGFTDAIVNDVRLPKSAIINRENQENVYAFGDEVTNGLILQDLPSFTVSQRLKSNGHAIRDMKCAYACNQTLVGCLSGDTLQLFRDIAL